MYVVGTDVGIYMLRLEKIIYRYMACPLCVHSLLHIEFNYLITSDFVLYTSVHNEKSNSNGNL